MRAGYFSRKGSRQGCNAVICLPALQASAKRDPAAAAKEFGLARSTLRNQVLNRKIPATKSGRDWLVARADMFTYLDNRAPSGRPARRKKARRPKATVAHG